MLCSSENGENDSRHKTKKRLSTKTVPLNFNGTINLSDSAIKVFFPLLQHFSSHFAIEFLSKIYWFCHLQNTSQPFKWANKKIFPAGWVQASKLVDFALLFIESRLLRWKFQFYCCSVNFWFPLFFLRHEWFGMLLSLLFSTLMDRSLCMVYGAHAVQVHFDSIVDVKSQKSKSWLQIIMKLNENKNINHANS